MGLKKGANADEIKKAYRKVNTELNIIDVILFFFFKSKLVLMTIQCK